MKSAFILASVLSLAIAGPIVARDECACDFMCPQSIPLGCQCQAAGIAECASTIPSTCATPTLSPACQAVLASTTIATPTATATATADPNQHACGTRGAEDCATGYTCTWAPGQDNSNDTPGTCLPNAVCGGIVGDLCSKGTECVLDEACVSEGGNDCQGTCEPLSSKLL